MGPSLKLWIFFTFCALCLGLPSGVTGDKVPRDEGAVDEDPWDESEEFYGALGRIKREANPFPDPDGNDDDDSDPLYQGINRNQDGDRPYYARATNFGGLGKKKRSAEPGQSVLYQGLGPNRNKGPKKQRTATHFGGYGRRRREADPEPFPELSILYQGLTNNRGNKNKKQRTSTHFGGYGRRKREADPEPQESVLYQGLPNYRHKKKNPWYAKPTSFGGFGR